MKKKFIILILFFAISIAKAQNNLIFNEVKLITLSSINPVIVPTGKVWKIEHVDCGGGMDCSLFLNEVDYKVQNYNSSMTPLWLPAGTSIKRTPQNFNNDYIIRRISVIEFNVTQ